MEIHKINGVLMKIHEEITPCGNPLKNNGFLMENPRTNN